jgi:hypothetical protein
MTLLQPDIIANVYNSQQLKEFRARKLELSFRDFPLKETEDFIEPYYQRLKQKIAIPKNAILITMPSGSGTNIIPDLITRKLAQNFKCAFLKEGVLSKLHKGEAKLALSLHKKIKDPLAFKVVEKLPNKMSMRLGFIVDDLIATGESAGRQAIALQSQGIKVSGYINLVAVDKRYPNLNDLERLSDKLLTFVMCDREKLVSDIRLVFLPYTRQKLN